MKRYVRASEYTKHGWDTIIRSLEIEASDNGLYIEPTSETGDPETGGKLLFNILSSDRVVDECGISVKSDVNGPYGKVYVIFHRNQSASVVSVDRAVEWFDEYFSQ